VALSRRAPEVPSGARRSRESIHELTSTDWAGERAGLKEGLDSSNHREVTLKRKEKVGTRNQGWGGGGGVGDKKTKKLEPRPRWKIGSLTQSPCSTLISRTWQKIPKSLKIGSTGFVQSFVSGRINRHQLFT
jgi:hypothetical protein